VTTGNITGKYQYLIKYKFIINLANLPFQSTNGCIFTKSKCIFDIFSRGDKISELQNVIKSSINFLTFFELGNLSSEPLINTWIFLYCQRCSFSIQFNNFLCKSNKKSSVKIKSFSKKFQIIPVNSERFSVSLTSLIVFPQTVIQSSTKTLTSSLVKLFHSIAFDWDVNQILNQDFKFSN